MINIYKNVTTFLHPLVQSILFNYICVYQLQSIGNQHKYQKIFNKIAYIFRRRGNMRKIVIDLSVKVHKRKFIRLFENVVRNSE